MTRTDIYKLISNTNDNLENYILTVIDGENTGAKAFYSDGKLIQELSENGFFEKNIGVFKNELCSEIITIAGQKIYAEKIGHEHKLVICGAGHVSIPIIKIGKMTGFTVVCIEDRPMFANDARNAGVDQVICDNFVNALEKIPGDDDTYFVIVTRGHRSDQECLKSIAEKKHAYIGLMGSRRRVAIVKEQLISEGASREVLDRVYTPIGLDIGAETPEEIAVAVMAEIIKVKRQDERKADFPKEILEMITRDNSSENGEDTGKVLATIVSRKGSAPREVGTKMLILHDGGCIGTIGGGCVEAEVVRRGREMLMENESEAIIQHIDLTADAAAEEGMVCGGVLEVLMEKI